MGFVEAVQSVLSKYAVSSGRASRSEFWWFQLFFFLAAIVLDLVDHILTGKTIHAEILLDVGLFLPALGLALRRLHDIDRSG